MEALQKSSLTSTINSIGIVVSTWQSIKDIQITGQPGTIRIFPEYLPAMYRMLEHSHVWVLCWFHQADRSILLRKPVLVNEHLPEYGVFGLRTAGRPNPIALTLVKLEKIEGDTIYVSGLDAVDGTPVLDIKPYYEADIIFSPQTPYIRPHHYEMRMDVFRKQAMAHHGEICLGLELGVKMALLVDEYFGQIQSPDLILTVRGDACLADVLQGLTRARLANPARFSYQAIMGPSQVIWQKDGKYLKMTVRSGIDEATAMMASEHNLFDLDIM